ncbi:MAG: glycerophosphodiester phosphodiesterase family protein [Planctomycetota bacterium]
MRPMSRILSGLVVIVSAAAGALATPAGEGPQFVVAHRGASAYIPEHTLAAYAFAHAAGAKYIEPDVVLTKDGVLICSHDIHLEISTNVEEVFPDRAREDGRYYAIDFTVEEIRQLSRTKGNPAYHVGVPTLDDMIEMVRAINIATGEHAGIAPEMKDPAFHRSEGVSIANALAETLERHGYKDRPWQCIVQSFDVKALLEFGRTFGPGTRRMLCIGGDTLLDENIAIGYAEWAWGIAVPMRWIEKDGAYTQAGARWVKTMQSSGLNVFVYTFNGDFETAQRFFDPSPHGYDVDGIFADNPDVAQQAITRTPENTGG